MRVTSKVKLNGSNSVKTMDVNTSDNQKGYVRFNGKTLPVRRDASDPTMWKQTGNERS